MNSLYQGWCQIYLKGSAVLFLLLFCSCLEIMTPAPSGIHGIYSYNDVKDSKVTTKDVFLKKLKENKFAVKILPSNRPQVDNLTKII